MTDPVDAPWIALAADGPILRLAGELPVGRLSVLDDADRFTVALTSARPSIAILQAPPAGEAELEIALRERRRRAGLRIVHLSPARAVDGRLDALRRGVDEALPATINSSELGQRLDLLEQRARVRSSGGIPVADGVILDPVAHEVRRDGRLVHLRPKEYQLLAMLAGHPGRAYTRRQLLDRVWGEGHAGDPRTVDVHVRWLRAKLEARPADPIHLVTVRGVGYRLDPTSR